MRAAAGAFRAVHPAWAAFVREVRADAPYHLFIAAYALAGLATAVAAGVPGKFAPLAYAAYALPLAAFALVIGLGLWSMWTRSPFASLRRACAALVRPRALAATLLFASLCVHMGIFTSVKTMLTDIRPFFADPMLADLDEWLHGMAPWHVTTALVPPALTVALCRLYFGGWGLLLPTCLLACVFLPQLRHVRAQYLWTYLLVWPLLGNVVAGALISAGPVFYGLVTGDAGRFAGLTARLARFQPLAEGMNYLWDAYLGGRVTPAGGISAFPSMHLANATLFVLLAMRIHKRLGAAAIAFCGAILFCSVHLGWHYAVDGYFSILATLALWRLVGSALRPARRASDRPTATHTAAMTSIEQ